MSNHSMNIEIKHNIWNTFLKAPVENVKRDLEYSSPEQLIDLIVSEIQSLRVQLEKGMHYKPYNNMPVELIFEIKQPAPNFLRHAFEKLIKLNFSEHHRITSITISNDSNLNAHLKTLFDNHDKRALSILMPGILTIIGGTALATYQKVMDSAAGFLLLISAIATMSIRHWYLSSSAKPYQKDAISEINDHEVLTALKKGSDSSLGMEGMGHYVLSYFSLSSWKHPRAFAAGLHIGNQNDQDTINLIQDKYANPKP